MLDPANVETVDDGVMRVLRRGPLTAVEGDCAKIGPQAAVDSAGHRTSLSRLPAGALHGLCGQPSPLVSPLKPTYGLRREGGLQKLVLPVWRLWHHVTVDHAQSR